MTVGICMHFEPSHVDVYSGRQVDLDAWRYVAKAFGIDALSLINLTSSAVQWNDEGLQYSEYADLASFEAAESGATLVYLDPEWRFPEGMTPDKLGEYTHPTSGDIWYVFGPATGFVPEVGDGKNWLTIPQCGVGACHAEHIAAAVLWHRCDQVMGG